MQLYRGLILSRLLYALPLVHLGNAQSSAVETLQRVAVRLCLGLPRYSPNVPTLVEARVNLVENHGRELTLRHIARQTACRSTARLLNRLRQRPLSCLGSLATEFMAFIGDPDTDYPAPPPYAPPLNINEIVPTLRSKRNAAQVVARTTTEDHIETLYQGWMRIYTDGSVLHSSKSSTAAVYIPDLNVSHARKLSFHATSTTAELVALRLGLDALEELPYCGKALLLTDSKIALQHLGNLDGAPQYARYIAHLARNLQAKGWEISFQWLPSHVGILGNETADLLAAAAHQLGTPIIMVPKIHEAKLLIHQAITQNHPDPRVADGRPPPRVPSKLPRASASVLHRLRTGCAFTASAIHRIDATMSPNCPTCDTLEDVDHLFWACPNYADERKIFFDRLQIAGVARSTAQDILFPPGSIRDAATTFSYLLVFLEDTCLLDRL